MSILDWFKTAADVALQKEVTELREENRRLSDEIRERDKQAEQEGNLFFARNAYWKKDETALLAYCPPCFASKKQLIPLRRLRNNLGVCDICKSTQNCVYEGPRPKEGDDATPIPTESRGATIARTSRSRRDQYRQ